MISALFTQYIIIINTVNNFQKNLRTAFLINFWKFETFEFFFYKC